MLHSPSTTSNQLVIVAMSGGVDSSVSAWLLKQQGYEVQGLFMKNWEEDDGDDYCTAAKDVADAEAVCERIGIVLHTINFSAEYWDAVFSKSQCCLSCCDSSIPPRQRVCVPVAFPAYQWEISYETIDIDQVDIKNNFDLC